MGSWSWPASVAIASTALASFAACAGCAVRPDDAQSGPPDLLAQVRQSRLDQSIGNIRIQVTNEGTTPVRVDDVVLHVEPFPDTESNNDAVLSPGQAVDFRMPMVEPACTSATPTPGPAFGEFDVDGQRVEIEVTDDHRVLDRLLTGHCLRQALTRTAAVMLGTEWALDSTGSAMLGAIELKRVAAGPAVTLEQVSGSATVGFEPVQPSQPLATLGRDQDAVAVPVRVTPSRCEPHARGEDKKRFLFPAWLRLDGTASEIYLELKAGQALQASVERLCDVKS